MSEPTRSVTPLFLMSMPRAGSTLLQRVLAGHPQISSTNEPWIMLPLLYSLRSDGIYTEYAQVSATTGMSGFVSAFPRGTDDYRDELAAFARRLYARASAPGARYFLDKTPRYHLIVDELFELFPEGRFVFLWRNPLAIVASMLAGWDEGRWNLYKFRVDLYEGPHALTDAYTTHAARALAVRYEDFIAEPEETTRRLLEALDLPFDPTLTASFAKVDLAGRMGDPTGRKQYTSLSSEPLTKWRQYLVNPLRKSWAAGWLRWIGADALATMGYDLDALLAELDSVPTTTKYLASDLARRAYGAIYPFAELRQLLLKVKKLPDWRRIRVHN